MPSLYIAAGLYSEVVVNRGSTVLDRSSLNLQHAHNVILISVPGSHGIFFFRVASGISMNLSDTESESETSEDGGHEVTIEEQLLWSTLHTALKSNHWASRFKAGQHSHLTVAKIPKQTPSYLHVSYHYVLTV